MSRNNNNNRNNNDQQYKRSSAVYTKIKDGDKQGLFVVNAWRSTKNGLMTAFATPLADYVDGKNQGVTVHVGKQKGNEFIRYKVQISMNGMTQNYYTVMRLDTKVIVIKELSLCLTPNGSGHTRNGKKVTGYFGSNFKRK